jgi:glycosyltransferase involved in cell wall biosynthesis
MKIDKLVSVIIPAYNQGQYLGKTIQSVLDQDYPEFEILVIDDGSTDDTADVTRRFADPRIRYIYQENRGLSGARNTGIQHAHGQYLTYLDSDDLFLPEKLSLLVGALEANTQAGFAAGQAIPIDEHDRPIGKIFDTPLPGEPEKLLLWNPLHVGSMLVTARWQSRAGLFDESLRSYEDWDMWLRLARLGCPMVYVDQPVSKYRFHREQMTRIGRQMTQATFSVLDKVFTDPDLPESWQAMHDTAYSNANLRAMAQAYQAQDYPHAQQYLLEAIRLDPTLLENNAERLAHRLNGLANAPKNKDPLAFLENIYHHLPEGLEPLRARTSRDLSQSAVDLAFQAYRQRDYATARRTIQRALQYQPSWIRNRGVLSVWFKAYTRPVLEFIFSS